MQSTLGNLRARALRVFILSFVAWSATGEPQATIRQYCHTCHGKAATGGISFQKLAQDPVGDRFRDWERVAHALESRHMPPAKMPQPADEKRAEAAAWVRAKLKAAATKAAGDPGPVTLRRLSSAEYGYTVQDLTGLQMPVDRDFVSDSVGGEGFTNFGDVQFMEEANLERYLEMAKAIADRAIVGAGPLHFYEDPGKSGMEMSAIRRIQAIYEKHGFRAVAGEGGRPYGLDLYGKAFYVAWQFQHRASLGKSQATIESLARAEGISPRFARHIHGVMSQGAASYPLNEMAKAWRSIPATIPPADARARAVALQKQVIDWPRWVFAAGELAAGGQGDERAQVLTSLSLKATPKFSFRYVLRVRDQKLARAYLSLVPLNPRAAGLPRVAWQNARVRFVSKDRGFSESRPLRALLDQTAVARLGFEGEHFFTQAGETAHFDIAAPAGSSGVELQVEAVLDPAEAAGAVLRCTISDREEAAKGRPVWALLADPASDSYRAWLAGVLEFAAKLPQNSQGEAAPSDKDLIPEPFDNTYNQPERDLYHVKVKYFRQDDFLTQKILDAPAKAELDAAWSDLKTSFEMNNAFAQCVLSKFKLDAKGKTLAELTPAELESFPPEPRRFLLEQKADYEAAHAAQKAARARHLNDAIEFASRAWRRPPTAAEREQLRSFYANARDDADGDHAKAVRALLTRILVSPAFLYRLEAPMRSTSLQPVPAWDLANRLSYFLWASMPDAELRRAASAGELANPQSIRKQVKRMLADPKARRMATEFFGQWLGFYRFDQHRGVDTTRFPEFTDEVKQGMYEEAIAFFEHLIRQDRPVKEIFSADYTFLNKALAQHYGISSKFPDDQMEMAANTVQHQRGGALRLGAVLTATSAPLRTSPVKRGDWVLRRVLGTPTPPPPPDAGSIPGDEKAFGGMTLAEKLKAHQRNATCAGCHSRIDPLGFPLEKFDAVGRVRQTYADGKPVQDQSETADHRSIAGVDGLLAYLQTQQDQVLKNLSDKLLGYALGRTVRIGDQPLVEKLVRTGGGAPFSQWVTEVVLSPQFRMRKPQDASMGEASND
jgi:mono/diheme cytochrome c family protein